MRISQHWSKPSGSCGCVFAGALVSACLLSAGARADAPVSLGNQGSLQRAQLTQGATRGSSSASFGTPQSNADSLFSIRWRFPLYVAGDEADNVDTTPYTVTQGAKVIPGVMGAGPFDSAIALDDLSSFASYIPVIKIGQERKPFHFQFGAINYNMGHGSIVDDFTNSPEGAGRKFGLLLELNSASLGGQVSMGDVTKPLSLVTGRVYGRPILWYVAPDSILTPNEFDVDPRSELAGMWITGLSVAVDGFAPENGGDSTGIVYAAGWDNEAAILDNKLIQLQGYIDLNVLGGNHFNGTFGSPVGFGAHPGLSFGLDLPMMLRFNIDAEYNIGSQGYVPRYFDRLYFIERDLAFGSKLGKSELMAPASHGYDLKLGVTFVNMLSFFLEARDQAPLIANQGKNSASLTAGASFFWLMFGGSATMSQAGIQRYADSDLFRSGFIFTAEGRIALIANLFHVVGRYYRIHEPDDITVAGGSYTVLEGALIGLELNFDLTTPLPL